MKATDRPSGPICSWAAGLYPPGLTVQVILARVLVLGIFLDRIGSAELATTTTGNVRIIYFTEEIDLRELDSPPPDALRRGGGKGG